MSFDTAFHAVLQNEGGYTNDERDPGNWTGGKVGQGTLKGTKYGISAAAYPDLDIKNLTPDVARSLYYTDYWTATGCQYLPDAVAGVVFDMAVNSGPGHAIRTLQKAVKVPVDGILGPKTIAAVQGADPGYLFRAFNGARLEFLTGLDDKRWLAFGRGLVKRVARFLQA